MLGQFCFSVCLQNISKLFSFVEFGEWVKRFWHHFVIVIVAYFVWLLFSFLFILYSVCGIYGLWNWLSDCSRTTVRMWPKGDGWIFLGDTPHTVHKLSKCLPSPTYLDAVNTFPTLTCGSLTAYLCAGMCVCVCCGFDGADSTNKQSAKLSEAGKYVY